MSSNAVSNQPTTGFFARAKEQLQEKFNIGSEVESSSTKSKKLTSEGKETYKTNIEESLNEVNIDSIQEKDADSGLLRSKVFTLDNTASDEIAKMSKALTLALELINKSGGAEKTFMAQNSTDALKDKVLELALKISDTKNDDDDPARASLKSLAATVVEKSFPKLLDNGKTGLTQDETQSIKMMLFSNNDAAAFAGAVKLLQSVKSYEEVAPDAVKEKTLSDGTTSLKVNPDSVYKKILKAVGSGSVGTHITEILKATVDKALHGRLTKDEQDILKTDPSLKNAYDTVHRDLISKIEQRSRDNIIKPLKDDLTSLSKDVLVNKYFGDSELSDNKILTLVKKTVRGIIDMVRPSGNEFSKRAFGAGSFYDSSLKLNTLADKVDTDIRHLTNLENRVGMTQDRLATGSSTKLDIPLDVIARKDNEGADTVAKLIKFIAGDVEKHAEYDPEALKKWQESFKAAVDAPAKIADIQGAANPEVQTQIAALANNKETSIGGLLITKLKDDASDLSSVQVKLGSDTVTTNAEGASKVIESYNQHLEAQRKSEEGFQIAGNLAKAYLAVDPNASQGKTLKEQLVAIKDNLSGADNVQKFTSALKQDSDLITYNFGLESSRKTDEESILKSLAKLAPETREDLVSVKSTIEEATSKATKLIKDESKAVPHLAISTGQAIRDGLLSSDGETFKVSSALGQHLFDSVQQSVGKEAGAAYNKLLDQKFARVNDIGKADAELAGNTNTNSLITKDVADNNYHQAIVDLNAALLTVHDKDAKAFIESFKNSNQDLLNASNYKGEPTEDKARFNLLMSKLVDSALELKDDNAAGYTKVLTDARVGSFIDTNKLANVSDTDRSSMNKKAAVLSEVLDSMPDTKEMDILSKISRGTVRSFQSLENVKSSEWQRKIVDKMVTGFLEMARTGAVKLDSIKEIISKSDNSSNAMENLLKTTLVSRLQSAAV